MYLSSPLFSTIVLVSRSSTSRSILPQAELSPADHRISCFRRVCICHCPSPRFQCYQLFCCEDTTAVAWVISVLDDGSTRFCRRLSTNICRFAAACERLQREYTVSQQPWWWGRRAEKAKYIILTWKLLVFSVSPWFTVFLLISEQILHYIRSSSRSVLGFDLTLLEQGV